MLNCHAVIRVNVCNWFTHLQPEWQSHVILTILFLQCSQI